MALTAPVRPSSVASTSVHHGVEACRVPGRERVEQRDDGIPRVGPDRADPVPSDVGRPRRVRDRSRIDLFPVECGVRRHRHLVEDANVPRQSFDHHSAIGTCDDAGRECGIAVGEHLEPLPEADDVERFVVTGAAPEVDVQERVELGGRGQGEQTATRLEAVAIDDPVKGFRGKRGNDPFEMGRVQETRQPPGVVSGHGPPMIPAGWCEKQSRSLRRSTGIPIVGRCEGAGSTLTHRPHAPRPRPLKGPGA